MAPLTSNSESYCFLGIDDKCLDTPLNFPSLNIHRVMSNFQSLEHHLSSAKPSFLPRNTGV